MSSIFVFPRITITILSSPLSPSSFHISIRLNVSPLAQLPFYPVSRGPFTKYLGWNDMCERFDKAPETDRRSFVSLSALRASLRRLRCELWRIRTEKNLWYQGLTIQKVLVFSFWHYLCVRSFSIKRYVRPTDPVFREKKELRRDKIRWTVALHRRHNIPFFYENKGSSLPIFLEEYYHSLSYAIKNVLDTCDNFTVKRDYTNCFIKCWY